MNKTIEKTSQLAKNYALALIDNMNNKNLNTKEFLDELELINNTIKNSNDLFSVLVNPTITNEIKYEILEAIFQNKISIDNLNFLKILVENERIKDFSQIYYEFKFILNVKNNIQPVNIISAIELSNEQKSKIIEKLSNKLKKNILPDWTIDRSIIAGIVIKIYDNIIDMSLKNRIDRLSKSLTLK